MAFGRSKAKQVTRDQPKVTFKDVAGIDEAVEELQEIKEFLGRPQKFRAMGPRSQGVLLFGPPGTGKTLLAGRWPARRASLLLISGSDFVEMFVASARAGCATCSNKPRRTPGHRVIDELDAVGRHRGAGLGGGHDERSRP